MAVSQRQKNQHLLWRAGFGPMAETFPFLDNTRTEDLWWQLIKSSSKRPSKLQVADNLTDGLFNGIGEVGRIENSKKVRQQRRKDNRSAIQSLNLYWLNEFVSSGAQLREKMSLFWHGHFACRVINSYFQQELLHVIRVNALGNFGELLRAVSKTPAMLQFLNNQQNRRKSPNENFAREVMELFTLGRGHYTEKDISEAARALTGWGFNMKGEFIERPFQHDGGAKTFLGKTGNFDGDDILNILLEQRQTAKFITEKIYRFLVNEIAPKELIDELANKFYENNYEILPLLNDIFTSSWFYEEKNLGSQVKSPVVLLAGIRRMLPMEIREEVQLLYQKVLGQVLFFPPNVAGWAGGRSWIDSSTLMLRLQLPMIIAGSELLQVVPKSDDDVNMGRSNDSILTKAIAEIDWKPVLNGFSKVERDNLVSRVMDALLQTLSRPEKDLISKYADSSSRETFIKSCILRVMSLPEYQLC